MRRWILASILASAATAHAECPASPDDVVCRPWSAVLMPSVFGTTFNPHGIASTYVGAGVEAVLLAWSDNSPAFGPSQGRVRLDFALLDSTATEPDLGAMSMVRLGTQLGFERNASRAYGIPFFAFDIGRLSTESATRWFADGGLGVYVLHRRSFTVDVEVTGVLPFSDPHVYAGFRTRLGVSFALW